MSDAEEGRKWIAEEATQNLVHEESEHRCEEETFQKEQTEDAAK